MYYESMHEEIFENDKEVIEKAIAGIKDGFRKNIFPYMGVSWDAYPNHIGHLEFDGCFRCHNDRHVSPGGKVISMDCNLCHTIIAQGAIDTLQLTDMYQSLEFIHPNESEPWNNEACSECHKELY